MKTYKVESPMFSWPDPIQRT